MWPYAFLVLFPIVIQHVRMSGGSLYLTRSGSHKNENILKLFWGILLVLLILRHEVVGTDTINYSNIFWRLSRSSWESVINYNAEVAYSVLNKLVSVFTEDFRGVMIIAALISVYYMARAYLQYSADASLTIALFIMTSNFAMMFSGLRQIIAISLGFVAFEYVREKRLLPFLGITFLATLFHTSAFMILFMYPLYHLRITRSWMLIIVPMMGLLFIFNVPIFSFLTSIMSQFTEYEAGISSTGAYTMLILYGLLAVFAYIIPDERALAADPDALGLRNFLLMSVALQMFAPLHTLAMRMNYYYMAFIPLAIPKVIEYRSHQWSQVAVFARYVMVAFFILYFFWSVPSDNPLNIYPYHFLWEPV